MRKVNITLVITIVLISLFGLLMIYSSSYVWAEYKFNDSFKYVKHQLLFFLIGLILIYFISKINYRKYYQYSTQIFVISLVLLILVLIPGIGSVRNGSRSWFGIGSFGIQPSEFAKISIIILTSKNNHRKFHKLRWLNTKRANSKPTFTTISFSTKE